MKKMHVPCFSGFRVPFIRLPKILPLAPAGLAALWSVAAAPAQTVGTGTITSPAVGPAPAYSYGYGTGISGAVLIKNWDFGTGTGSTIHNISELTTNFQYHDQFGLDANGGGYGSRIVVPDASLKINATQPVEGVNTSGAMREFLAGSMKTYLRPLDGAIYVDPDLMNVGNGSFQAKWTAPRGGNFLGMDIIWETRVRYVTPPYFWFAIWTCGNKWSSPNAGAGVPGGAEMDLIESFGYNNGGTYTNYVGRYWHSSPVGGNSETNYHASWGNGMSRYGITSFDATQWHTWTWVYKADNSFTSYLDGIPVQRGKIVWTNGGRPTDEQINMSFIFDGAWGHKNAGGMNFTMPAGELSGKYYEWDYSRVYFRVPVAADRRNLALTGTISGVSAQQTGNLASKLIDDIYNTDSNRWTQPWAGYPAWVEIDLGGNKQVDETEIIGVDNNAFRYRIEAKQEGGTYATVVDRTTSTATTPIHWETFSPVTARYVKLTLVGSSNGIGWPGVREFKILGSDVIQSLNLALNRPAVASSTITADVPAAKAVDGNSATRWGSQYATSQWIYVDLGTSKQLGRVKINWEAAYASAYKVQVSNDASSWTDIYSTTTGNGGVDDLLGISGTGRYVRVLAVTNATTFGISIYDLEVYALPPNLALNRPAVASSTITASFPASQAVDGSTTTRWASHYNPSGWLHVDLGSTQQISRVKIRWEAAYASAYKLQVSNDAANWTDIYSTATGNGALDDLTGLSASGRYVRVLAVTNATAFGISIYELEVYP